MINFLEKFGQRLEPVAAKLASNKILTAIKDGFMVIMPLLIIGSFAIVLNSVILDWGDKSLWYSIGIKIDPATAAEIAQFKVVGNFITQGSLSIVALLISFTIAYSYSKQSGHDGLSAGVLGLASFMTVQIWQTPVDITAEPIVYAAGINPNNIGTVNILTAMVVALITGIVYVFFIDKKITVKMPEGVPPGVIRAFEALIPGTVLLFGFAILASILQMYGTELSVIISSSISQPLQKIGAQGPMIAYLYATLANILYFFGIHGPNVLAFVDSLVLTPASVENATMIAAGNPSTLIFSKGMLDSFVFIGGGGATLGLIISIFIVSKRKADRAIAKFAFVPAFFNINEPLVFGLPIVMNPILFIPFILAPPILLSTAWFQIVFYHSIGLLSNTGAVLIPWISPVGIGAFLAYQSFFAIVIALTQLVISIIIYMPFVFASNFSKEETNEV